MSVVAPRVGRGKLALAILLCAAVMAAALALTSVFRTQDAHADHLDGSFTATIIWNDTNNAELTDLDAIVTVTLTCSTTVVMTPVTGIVTTTAGGTAVFGIVGADEATTCAATMAATDMVLGFAPDLTTGTCDGTVAIPNTTSFAVTCNIVNKATVTADIVSNPGPDHWNVIGSDHEICLIGSGISDNGVESITAISLTNQNGANASLIGQPYQLNDAATPVADSSWPICFLIRSTTPGETVGATIEWLEVSTPQVTGGAFTKEWSEMVHSRIIVSTAAALTAAANGIAWQDAADAQGTLITADEDATVSLVAVVHGEHTTSGGTGAGIVGYDVSGGVAHADVDGVVVTVTVASPNGCVPITNVTGSTGTTGAVGLLQHGGHAFTVTANCEEITVITVTETYPNSVASSYDNIVQTITINWTTDEVSKQPHVRKAGEIIVLEHFFDNYWTDGDRDGRIDYQECSIVGRQVQFVKLDSPVGVGGLFGIGGAVTGSGADSVWSNVDANCMVSAMATSEDPGEMDVEVILYDQTNCNTYECTAIDVHPFLTFFVKIYSVEVSLVPGDLKFAPSHNASTIDVDQLVIETEAWWSPSPAVYQAGTDADLPSTDVRSETRVVSDYSLVRVNIKDWFRTADSSGRADVCLDVDGDGGGDQLASVPYHNTAAGVAVTTHTGCPDLDDELLAGGYWLIPDDWTRMAGNQAALMRAQWDVLCGPTDTACVGAAVIGPKRMTDTHDATTRTWVTHPWPVGETVTTYKSIIANGVVNVWDAPMPLEKVTISITGSGELLAVDKNAVYLAGNNPFYSVWISGHSLIPAKPGGSPGYDWDSLIEGPYQFWRPLQWLTVGSSLQVYSDNRGQAMALVNGDANLAYTDCSTDSVTGTKVCEPGDTVGVTTVTAIADYPYFRKHRDLKGSASITWEWAGYKRISVVPVTSDANHTYVVAHLLDRDGECIGENPTTAPKKWDGTKSDVRLEPVHFELSGDGVAISAGLTGVLVTQTKATTVAGASQDHPSAALPFANAGSALECQAWVLIEHPAEGNVQVSIDFYEPEGQLKMSVEFPQTSVVWGDVDGSGAADAVDALKILQSVVGLPDGTSGPAIGDSISIVDGATSTAAKWGDIDGDGDVDAVDALEILQYIVDGTSSSSPAVGATVKIT